MSVLKNHGTEGGKNLYLKNMYVWTYVYTVLLVSVNRECDESYEGHLRKREILFEIALIGNFVMDSVDVVHQVLPWYANESNALESLFLNWRMCEMLSCR